MKRIFVIDRALILLFILTAFTGIGLRVSGLGDNHDLWHDWAVAHVAVSLLFAVFVMDHVKAHWGWYKGVKKLGLGRRHRVTVAVSCVFVLVCLTGLILLGVNGANSLMGLLHYWIGLVSILLFLGHIVKRLPILRKVCRKKAGQCG